MVSVIITSAGNGSRAGFGENKLLQKLNGKSVIERTFDVFSSCSIIDEIIITSSTDDFNTFSKLFPTAKVVLGGKTRQQSVKNGLDACSGEIVLIHDGARPFVTEEIILDCVENVKKYGSGISAYPSSDTITTGKDGFLEQHFGKIAYVVQTPQGFYLNDITRAHALANGDESDDSILYLNHVGIPHYSLGSPTNKKLTFKEDFTYINDVQNLEKPENTSKKSSDKDETNSAPNNTICSNENIRIGNGYDTHKLVKNRKLILGGICIPNSKGLLGHSDADVLAHAIMDALLSGAGLKDIGYYFPDNDENFKDISSMILLERVLTLIKNEGYVPQNVTACILAQKPKLAPFVDAIKQNIASALNIDVKNFGLTVTTTEGLGFIGREKGIAVYSTCILKKI